MVKKSLTPFKGPKVETIIGAKKERSPKTPKKSEKKLKALIEQSTDLTVNSPLVSPSKKIKKKSFHVIDMPEEFGTPGTPTSLKKKKKLSTIKMAETESPLVTEPKKKKRSQVAEAESSNAPDGTPRDKKLKKKSKGPAGDNSGEMETLTPAPKKIKKSAVATEEIPEQPQPVSSKKNLTKSGDLQKPAGAADGVVAEGTPKEGAGKSEGAKKKKRNRGKKTVKDHSAYTLFVGNLAFDTTEEDVRDHFGKKGLNVLRVFFPKDKDTNLMKGFAFVDLPDNDQYNKGLQMNGSFINNRRVRVQFTMPGNKSTPGRTKAIKKTLFKYAGLNKKGIAFK
ncbi:uncharacterized protein LOC135938723 [Cloeon dipterum]|uniref:uncharacterized protein LOC135938723 n=1 Tax=Cloeon dipterum TaxID=197152 RepID=UPI00321FCF2D